MTPPGDLGFVLAMAVMLGAYGMLVVTVEDALYRPIAFGAMLSTMGALYWAHSAHEPLGFLLTLALALVIFVVVASLIVVTLLAMVAIAQGFLEARDERHDDDDSGATL